MPDYEEEIKLAKKAAHAATGIIQKHQRENNFSINFKGKYDLVTDADVASEEAIKSMITEQFPDDLMLAEESLHREDLPPNRIWLIDPIDGTTNFAHGFPVFCVSIGLWQNQQPQVGVVLEVSSGQLFEARRGEGALLNGQAISVSSVEDAGQALVGTGFPYTDLYLVDHYLELFHSLMHNTQGVRRPGAASFDLCAVAAGWYDGFYEYALNPWDVGAAGLIIKEAGGIVTDWEGGDDWLFGERIIAGNASIHRFLQDVIDDHFSDDELCKS